MKLGLALGAAVIAITATVAYADSNNGRRFVFHRGGDEYTSPDTNNDGWLSREESAANADRLFADLDRDNNGRLNDRDEELLEQEIEAEVERAMAEVEIDMAEFEREMEAHSEALSEQIEPEVEASLQHLNDTNCETTTENSRGEVRTTTVCRDLEGADDDGERRADRRVHVIRNRGGDTLVHPVPPVPPMPPAPHVRIPRVPHVPAFHGPVFWGGGDNGESDLNGDGWLSREEFRAQQLRYFDAQDANNDGRIRYEEPPEPPQPPEPPRHHRDRDRD